MDIYANHQPEIDAAWDAIEARIDSLPHSLATTGRRFLESVRVEGKGHRIYFSSAISPPLLYVPLWLRNRFQREGHWPAEAQPDASRRLLLVGMWGYFYIRMQDDIIDGSDSADAEYSLFGNVCIAEMFAHLHALTGTPSFWSAFASAWADFTRFTLEERRQVRGSDAYPADLFTAQAQKVAFARIPALAACAIAGRLDLESVVNDLIHHLGIAYGLVNDVLGWPRDLRSRQCTYLLSRAGLKLSDFANSADELHNIEERLRHSLYDDGLLCATLAEAADWQHRAAILGNHLGLAEMPAYTAERIRWLEDQRHRIQIIQLKRALEGRSNVHQSS